MAMETWTREELELLHPEGSVMVQVDDEVVWLTGDDWSTWIDRFVGREKEFPAEAVEFPDPPIGGE